MRVAFYLTDGGAMAHAQTYSTSYLAAVQRQLCGFFDRLVGAPERGLLLDYDGTLAEFRPDAEKATPYREIPALLDRIRRHTDTRLAIVTGRRAYEAARLLGLKHVEVWGCHGLERLRADGTYEMPGIDTHMLNTISEADELLAEEGLSGLLEHKPAGTAVHWRGREAISAEVRQKVQSVWTRLQNKDGLRLDAFDGGMEIRVGATNKGDAVRTILSEMDHDAVVAYLGDDRTDEDAFLALEGRGLRVLVRTEFRETAADVWIRPPDGLVAFLADWSSACGGAS